MVEPLHSVSALMSKSQKEILKLKQTVNFSSFSFSFFFFFFFFWGGGGAKRMKL